MQNPNNCLNIAALTVNIASKRGDQSTSLSLHSCSNKDNVRTNLLSGKYDLPILDGIFFNSDKNDNEIGVHRTADEYRIY
jgi:hypothetical protein